VKPRSDRYHCQHDADLQSGNGPEMTCDVYWTVFYEQNGACGGCLRVWEGTPGASRTESGVNRLSLDHEHVGGKDGHDGPLRGLLCQPCNRLLNYGVVEQVLRRTDEDVIALSGGDVVTASQVRYVRNPPAARLGLRVWVTPRASTAGGRKTAGRAKASPLELTGPSVRELLSHPPRVGVMPNYPREPVRSPEPKPEPVYSFWRRVLDPSTDPPDVVMQCRSRSCTTRHCFFVAREGAPPPWNVVVARSVLAVTGLVGAGRR
jgi:hypothetical protein